MALVSERDENTCRKPFTVSESVAIGRRIEEMERPKAEAKKKASQPQKGEQVNGRHEPTVLGDEKFSAPKKPTPKDREMGQVAAKAAKAVEMSRPTYTKACEVVEAAKKKRSLKPIVEGLVPPSPPCGRE